MDSEIPIEKRTLNAIYMFECLRVCVRATVTHTYLFLYCNTYIFKTLMAIPVWTQNKNSQKFLQMLIFL